MFGKSALRVYRQRALIRRYGPQILVEGFSTYSTNILPTLLKLAHPKELKSLVSRTIKMAYRTFGAGLIIGDFLDYPANPHQSVLFGAFVSVYDDFCDTTTPERIQDLNDEIFDVSTVNGRLTKEFYYQLKTLIPPNVSPSFYDAFRGMNRGQVLSLRQTNPKSSIEEISEAIITKAEHAGRCLSYSVKFVASEIEDKLFREIGLMAQYFDDFEDEQKDREEGLRTLFTEGVMNEKDVLEKANDVERLAEEINPSKVDVLMEPIKSAIKFVEGLKE